MSAFPPHCRVCSCRREVGVFFGAGAPSKAVCGYGGGVHLPIPARNLVEAGHPEWCGLARRLFSPPVEHTCTRCGERFTDNVETRKTRVYEQMCWTCSEEHFARGDNPPLSPRMPGRCQTKRKPACP